MSDGAFMFSVGMLAEMTGGNRQYLSRKIKQLIEDPEIRLKAELHSNKEGYQIPEREVLRCFDKITPIQVKAYKESLLERTVKPKISRMGQKTEPAKEQFLEKENEVLTQWRFKLAGTPAAKKNSPEIREYLEGEIRRIKELRQEKLREYVLLEQFLSNCDKTIEDIEKRLD